MVLLVYIEFRITENSEVKKEFWDLTTYLFRISGFFSKQNHLLARVILRERANEKRLHEEGSKNL